LRHLLGVAADKQIEFHGSADPNGTVQVYRWRSERLAQAATARGQAVRAN
jgi:hypothetical protein